MSTTGPHTCVPNTGGRYCCACGRDLKPVPGRSALSASATRGAGEGEPEAREQLVPVAIVADIEELGAALEFKHGRDELVERVRAHLSTVDAPQVDEERIYPCDDCGTMRTKAEGGTTFTVCEACWAKRYRERPPSTTWGWALAVDAPSVPREEPVATALRLLLANVRWVEANEPPERHIPVHLLAADVKQARRALTDYDCANEDRTPVATDRGERERHVCGARGFADSGDACPACEAAR